jgi:glycosyltransferase involved in cell wall biosynthesis
MRNRVDKGSAFLLTTRLYRRIPSAERSRTDPIERPPLTKTSPRVKVLLVGNYVPERQHSMLGFARLMQEGLNRAGHDVRTLHPPVKLGKLGRYLPAAGKWLAYLDKFVLLPPLLRGAARDVDIVHICDHSNAMYVPRKRQVPHVVTCHDLLAVRGGLKEQTDCPASRLGTLLQRWILRGLMRADAVACDSSATLDDAHRLLPGRRRPPELLPIALRYNYKPVAERECIERLRAIKGLDLDKSFVLHVGSSLRRKNREGILGVFAAAMERIDAQLVFAGKPLEAHQRELAAKLNLLGRIVEAGEVRDEVLAAFYSRALVFLFPSRFEGFGWPIIEAQSCGCPVICANREPLVEVAGGSALMRDVEDEEGFAMDIVQLAKNRRLRCELIDRGFRNVLRYKPETMIARYLSLYERVLSPP